MTLDADLRAMMADPALDRLADEVRALSAREKVALARLIDAAVTMHPTGRRRMTAALLRLAAADLEAGRVAETADEIEGAGAAMKADFSPAIPSTSATSRK